MGDWTLRDLHTWGIQQRPHGEMLLTKNSDASCFTFCALLAIGIRFFLQKHKERMPEVEPETSRRSNDVVSEIEYISNPYETLRTRCPHQDHPTTRDTVEPHIKRKSRSFLTCPVLCSRSHHPFFIHRHPVSLSSTHHWHISRTLP